MGCLTAPSHRSVRMKFVVILSFLLLGVVLGDPRHGRGRGYGGYGRVYQGGRGYGIMVRDLLMPMLPLSRMPIDMEDMAVGTGAIAIVADMGTVVTAKEMLILSPT